MSVQELLQQIVMKTTPIKTRMISISTTNPESGVNFPTAISASEIALARFRVYHSWPNIRDEPFGGLPANDSFVFSYENLPDGPPSWKTIYLQREVIK